MKNIQDRVIVVGPVFIDEYAAGFQCLPKLVGIIFAGSPNEGHNNQVPLLRSKSELVIARDYSLQLDAQPLSALSSYSNRLVRRIKPGNIPSLCSQENRVPSLSHANIKCLSWRDSIDCPRQKRARTCNENRRVLRRVEFVPQDARPFR